MSAAALIESNAYKAQGCFATAPICCQKQLAFTDKHLYIRNGADQDIHRQLSAPGLL